ncbi:RNA-binding protein 4.2 [Chanos chanos]|uniref:RNA-binding protein 14 n=1 Tax=Chanos chanos TaxID=29144 RepID=A0A6J2VYQ4_CHACN|nr:RNA-binding protein 4.1-like [Chanos chanos]
MVKIFIGNLSASTTVEELRSLFSQYGKISECDIVKNFGFVHMNDMDEALEAISKLHHHELNGQQINVEMSRGKPKGSTKLHVSNISSTCTNQELRAKFEEYGPVVECDIVKDYAFVHMERMEDAMEAINGLDNSTFQGKQIHVQLSTSRLRTAPGMGDQTGCYVCGKQGHWSKDCHRGQNGNYADGPGGFRNSRGFPRGAPSFPRGGPGFPVRGYVGGPPPPPPPPPMTRRPSYGFSREYDAEIRDRYSGRLVGSYPERPATYERDRYGSLDLYEKYRARPIGSSYFEERHLSIPPPPPPSSSSPSLSRMRLAPTALDPYERRPLPTASSSAPAYYSRDRSPIRRVGGASEGYTYERSRLSPVSRSTTYGVSRARDSYTDRPRYAY